MPLLYRRLLNSTTLTPDDAVDLMSALDVGDYRELHFVLTVSQAGNGDAPVLVVKHASVNEESAYLDFDTPVKIALGGTGSAWFKVDSFTRWICWFVSGALNSEAVVTVDLIGKG